MARNLVDCEEGFLLGKRYVLMDRDSKFSEGFRSILKSEDVNAVRLPAKSPNLNAFIERFFRSLREECLDRMIFFGQVFLQRVVHRYLHHFHQHRNHQGRENMIINLAKKSAAKRAKCNVTQASVGFCAITIRGLRTEARHLRRQPSRRLPHAKPRERCFPGQRGRQAQPTRPHSAQIHCCTQM